MDSNTYYNISPNKFQKNILCTEKFADFAKKTQQLEKKRNNAATHQNNAAAFKTQAMGTLFM